MSVNNDVDNGLPGYGRDVVDDKEEARSRHRRLDVGEGLGVVPLLQGHGRRLWAPSVGAEQGLGSLAGGPVRANRRNGSIGVRAREVDLQGPSLM